MTDERQISAIQVVSQFGFLVQYRIGGPSAAPATTGQPGCSFNQPILTRFELESSRLMKRCVCCRKKASRQERGAVYIIMTP